jgi:hypothetical protein
MEGAKVVHLRIHVLKNERQEVRVGVDLELYIRREGEVGRSAAKLCRDGLVKPARGGCKRIRPVDGKVGYAWDDKGKGDPDATEGRGRCKVCASCTKMGRKNTYMMQTAKMMNTTVRRVSHLLPNKPICPRLNALHLRPKPSEFCSFRPFLVMAFSSFFPHSAPSAGTVTNSTGPFVESSSTLVGRGDGIC